MAVSSSLNDRALLVHEIMVARRMNEWEQDEEGRGDGEGGAEGQRRGQATPRTSMGTVTGGRGSAGSREPKRKAKSDSDRSELSIPQAAGWRQLTLNFGGTGGEGREGKAERKVRERAEGKHDARRSPNSVWNVERQPPGELIAVMAKDSIRPSVET